MTTASYVKVCPRCGDGVQRLAGRPPREPVDFEICRLDSVFAPLSFRCTCGRNASGCKICHYRSIKLERQRGEDQIFWVYGRPVLDMARRAGYAHTYRLRRIRRRYAILGRWLADPSHRAWLNERGISFENVLDIKAAWPVPVRMSTAIALAGAVEIRAALDQATAQTSITPITLVTVYHQEGTSGQYRTISIEGMFPK